MDLYCSVSRSEFSFVRKPWALTSLSKLVESEVTSDLNIITVFPQTDWPFLDKFTSVNRLAYFFVIVSMELWFCLLIYNCSIWLSGGDVCFEGFSGNSFIAFKDSITFSFGALSKFHFNKSIVNISLLAEGDIASAVSKLKFTSVSDQIQSFLIRDCSNVFPKPQCSIQLFF